MPKFKGIIIEGYSYTGKSSIFNELKKLQTLSNKERSAVSISEHFTQILNVNRQGEIFEISQDKHVSLLESHLNYLSHLSNWINNEINHGKSSSDFYYMIERYHLNHMVHFGNHKDIIQLQHKLIELNPICVLLIVSNSEMCKRIKLRYPQISEDDLKKEFEKFKQIQEKYLKAATYSIIPYMVINTDSMDWKGLANQIYSNM
ncbi:hypothetical protein [Macrococcus equipercicus]|uniref:Uncharacterized protein n=1 Tax=Macrococcus equipercicus TaxID=69967 RepID=A0A9Q9BWN4_9STAP|nr:hypothetical protein [Macrococcus equipercicus]UTH13852.1 hypothetical protein KFV11_00290 [Macrococcus equipercicus]